jgi:hypothetical protein
MVAPRREAERPGVVYILNAQQKPEPRSVRLGITDGSATEVISGEVKLGDLLIIGDSSQASQTPNSGTAPPFFPGLGGRGGGGGGGRGRGN